MLSVIKAEEGWYIDVRDVIGAQPSRVPVKFFVFALDSRTGTIASVYLGHVDGELRPLTGRLSWELD